MDHHLAKIGFRLFKWNPYIYVFEVAFVILTLYLGGVLLLGENKLLLNKLKKNLMDCFEMTNMCDASKVTGMNVPRGPEKGTITIDQK